MNRSRGVVLLATLVITVLAAMIAASLLFRMHAEVAASAASTKGEQAYEAAMSGVHTSLSVLLGQDEGDTEPVQSVVTARLGDPSLWYDNPDLFRHHLVCDDGADRWYFTLYAYHPADRGHVRFGLTDEAGKVNINLAPREVLERLPGMTADHVDALMDYRDADAETRDFGAEQDHYDRLPTPYLIKNGPFATLEELLLVKGFNGTLLYGEDANLNGLLEPNEDDSDERFPADDNDGQLDTGLYGTATVLSYGPDVDAAGEPRLDLNRGGGDLEGSGLPQQTIDFIAAYRADGQAFAHPSQLLGMEHRLRRNARGRGGRRAGTVIASGVDADALPTVMDRLTTLPGRGRAPWFGLVNVHTAPAEALAALPGLDAALAEAIVDSRGGLDVDERATTAWLYTRGLVDAETYRAIAPLLTPRGYQFRIRSIGFGVPCGRYRIIEAVIDLAAPEPAVAYLRDLTRLGPPFALTPELEEPGT